MGFSRSSATPVREVRDNLSQGMSYIRNAGAAAARGTRDAATPRVYAVLERTGIRKQRSARWPWVAGAIGAGVAVGSALAYLLYRQRTETIGESLLADELLDDSQESERRGQPQITDEQINEELVERASR
ncbi:hypothetical protein GCM10027447_16300 [Glycomyces halotolerans]